MKNILETVKYTLKKLCHFFFEEPGSNQLDCLYQFFCIAHIHIIKNNNKICYKYIDSPAH